MVEDMVNFCKDCTHFASVRLPGNPIHDLCRHPKSVLSVNVVSGEPKYCHASSMRIAGQACGQGGKLFEQKPEPKTPWWKFWVVDDKSFPDMV
jgi:hypothetical protein